VRQARIRKSAAHGTDSPAPIFPLGGFHRRPLRASHPPIEPDAAHPDGGAKAYDRAEQEGLTGSRSSSPRSRIRSTRPRLIEKIAELVGEKPIEGHLDLRDESDAKACASSSS
jgi:hypothetical protein